MTYFEIIHFKSQVTKNGLFTPHKTYVFCLVKSNSNKLFVMDRKGR